MAIVIVVIIMMILPLFFLFLLMVFGCLLRGLPFMTLWRPLPFWRV